MDSIYQIRKVIERPRPARRPIRHSIQPLGEYKGFKVFPDYWQYEDDRMPIADIASVSIWTIKVNYQWLASVNHSYVG